MLYFACLGAGYIMVEVGLIAHFVMALGNPTISASVLITGMLVFSGLGALVSERILPQCGSLCRRCSSRLGACCSFTGCISTSRSTRSARSPIGARLVFCFLLIAPPAFLMGFPMPTAMTTLGRLGKDHMFVWAWGVNGCFSVIGAAAAPVIATNFGLAAVIEIAGRRLISWRFPPFMASSLRIKSCDHRRLQAGLDSSRRGSGSRRPVVAGRNITILQRINDGCGAAQSLTKNS